ncbi:MAG TPA: TetR family transcriptional regulator [Solirubrobacteraceae bacterium]|nr:TetR family transcriptional regulator [Solirubrobacteraceae bacterium]
MSELQRARLLTAAAEVVAEVGYRGMSTARVSARAGVSRKTFYDLFTDREDCFLAAFDDTVSRIAAVATPAYDREERWREGVRAGLSSVLQFIGDEPVSGALVVIDALGAGPRVLERRAQWLATLSHIIDRGRSEVKAGDGPPPLTAEGVVGGAFNVLHARMIERDGRPSLELLNPLMAIIVLPYLGQAAAAEELQRTTVKTRRPATPPVSSPLDELDTRITYRTLRVLDALAALPGGSNREIADHAGVSDAGQISKLLARLEKHGLIHNSGRGQAKGERNVWGLTARGAEVEEVTGAQAGH